jgi:hydroxymethylpyrimidine pyrophosphatase-like HAD family hydrolase
MAKIVTFDFDDTLTLPHYDEEEELWTSGLEPNKKTISALKKFASNGYEVKIVTSRHGTGKHKKDVATFAKKYSLPVKDIIFTNGKDKVHTLLRIGSVLHYDDDPHELSLIKSKGIKTIHIVHPLDK